MKQDKYVKTLSIFALWLFTEQRAALPISRPSSRAFVPKRLGCSLVPEHTIRSPYDISCVSIPSSHSRSFQPRV